MKFPIGPTGPIGIAIRDINENLSKLVNFQKLKLIKKVFTINLIISHFPNFYIPIRYSKTNEQW